MIYRLRGTLVEKDTEGVVIDVGGVGYRSSASLAPCGRCPRSARSALFTPGWWCGRTRCSSSASRAREERAAFDALTAVSKVGPKLALSVLSSMSPPEISEAVARGDVIKLASVPGLGKKTAERLVLELKGKSLAAFGPEPAVARGDGGGGPYMEARDALAALGYRLEEAEKALNDVPPQDSVEKYIKEALRRIGSRR